MWICEKCGEPHQDQFRDCWKCAAAELETEEHVTATPPRPALPPPERKLRSVGSILQRAAVGFLIGVLVSLSSFSFIKPQAVLPDQDLSLAGRTLFALIVGALFGVVVGLFFWVVFPYESTREDDEPDTMDSAN
jgi:hypothetical protein